MKRLLLCVLLVVASGCSETRGNNIVMTDDRRYDPAILTIPAGEEVTWMNESDEAHSVTAYQSSLPADASYFSSTGALTEKKARADVGELMSAGDAVSIKFNVPGTYEYFCIPHEDQGMAGRIVVEG